jgi:WD40 repeat protein
LKARTVTSAKHERRRAQISELQNFLDIFETPEDDLAGLDDAKLDGSCQWFSDRNSFLSWRDSLQDYPPYYWLKGQQAAGKSILTAHIIRTLEEINADCSYYFFKHNDKTKISLSSCLRSLAYQMAISDLRVAKRLLILKADNVTFDKNNELAIWRKLFMNGIFEISLERTHFWVIDGLDECISQHSIVCLLAKGTNGFPLRVFMTSRPTSDIIRDVLQVKNAVYTDEMAIGDTRVDIEEYVKAHIEHLPLQGPTSRKAIVETILEKSCGSFLWVALVLEEMRSAFSIADIEHIMEEVPTGMDPLYERALASISRKTRGKKLIQAILQWTVCAVRPMTLQELEQALRLDTGEVVLDLERLINSTCWQFVQIDKSNRVSVLHETVRAFLLREDLQSDFAIDRRSGHSRIADVCLAYLCSNEMKPPQNQKLLHLYRAKLSSRSAFVKYACEYFSLHLRQSHAEDAQRFLGLFNFLEKNISSWIEYVARTGNLQPLIQMAKDMRGFIQARAKYYSPLGKQVQLVESWETDLVRLVSQFGKNLVQSPTAIFWLVPPFCPPMTAIGTLPESSARGLIVKGLKASTWNDRISCIQYRDIQTRTATCGVGTFAVGLSDKSIKFYFQSTCQEQQKLLTSQPAKLLAYSNSGKSLAAASIHFLTLFNLDNGKQLWQIRLPQECLTILFNDQDEIIWLVTKGGDLSSLSVKNGSCLSSALLSDDSAEGSGVAFRRIFVAAAFAFEFNLVAVAQRGRPVGLYEMEEGKFLGFCEWNEVESDGLDHAHMWIRDFLFRPNLETNVLAVLYHEGQLVLFDPYELTVQKCAQVDAHVMACSPDGHTLATGNNTGTIQIYDFETLTMIYKLVASDYSIKSLKFSSDGLRLIDIRGSQCNVW